MQKILVLLIILALPVAYFLYAYQNDMPLLPEFTLNNDPVVHVGNVPIRVEVADSASERARGLSHRDSLGETNGMFFIFDEADYHGIWMKDMRFAIDVIWVGEDLKVVDITPVLRPDTYPRQFEPISPARYAIEVNANYAASFGIAIGDEVRLPAELIPADLRPRQ
ncbi:MAG: DUF192 domain-containing protein [Bradymonadales bacterium]